MPGLHLLMIPTANFEKLLQRADRVIIEKGQGNGFHRLGVQVTEQAGEIGQA